MSQLVNTERRVEVLVEAELLAKSSTNGTDVNVNGCCIYNES